MASQQYTVTVAPNATPIKVDSLEQALEIAEILSREYGGRVEIKGVKSNFSMTWPSGGSKESLRAQHGIVQQMSQQSPGGAAEIAAEALDAGAATYAPFPEKTGDLLGKNGLARVHFFDGRFLTAATLQAEQIYWDARTRIAAQVHPAGIARGLGLTYPLLDGGPGVDPGALVTLQPGLAFDGYGRPIVVGAAYPFRLRDLIERWVQTPVAISTYGGTTFAPCLCTTPSQAGGGGGVAFPSGPYLLVIAASECPEGQAKVFGTACATDTSDTCEIDRWRGGFGLSLIQLPDLVSALAPEDEWERRGLVASWYFDTYDVRQDRWRGSFPLGAFGSDVVQPTGNPVANGEAVPLAVVWVGEDQGVRFFDTWVARRHLLSTHTATAAHRVVGAPSPAAVQARLHQFQVMLDEVLAAHELGRSVVEADGGGPYDHGLYSLGFRSIPPAGFLPLRRDDHRVYSPDDLVDRLSRSAERYTEGTGPSLLLEVVWRQARSWFMGTNVLPLPVVALHDDDVLRLLREVEQRDPLHLVQVERGGKIYDQPPEEMVSLAVEASSEADARRRRAEQERIVRKHLEGVSSNRREVGRRVQAMLSALDAHDRLAGWYTKAPSAAVKSAPAAAPVESTRTSRSAASKLESAMSSVISSGMQISVGVKATDTGAWRGFGRPVATSEDPEAQCVEVILASVLEALGGASARTWPLFELIRDVIARRVEPVRLVVPMSSAARVHPVFGLNNPTLAGELAQAKANWQATLGAADPDALGAYNGKQSFWSDDFAFEARPHDWVLYARQPLSLPMLLPQLMESLGCCGCTGTSCEDAAQRMADYIWTMHQAGFSGDSDNDNNGMPSGYDTDTFGDSAQFILFPAFIQAISLPDGCCGELAARLDALFATIDDDGVGLSRDALEWLHTWLTGPDGGDLASYALRVFGVMSAIIDDDFDQRSGWLAYSAFMFFARPDVFACMIDWYLENGEPDTTPSCWAAKMFCRTLGDLLDYSLLMNPQQVDDMIADPAAARVITLLEELLTLTSITDCCGEMGSCIADEFNPPYSPWSSARVGAFNAILSRLEEALANGGGVLQESTFQILRDDLYAVLTSEGIVMEGLWLLPMFTLAHRTNRVGLFVCAVQQWEIPEQPPMPTTCPDAASLSQAITTIYGTAPQLATYSEFVGWTNSFPNQSLVGQAKQYVANMAGTGHAAGCCTALVDQLAMTQFNPATAVVLPGQGGIAYPALLNRWLLHYGVGALVNSSEFTADAGDMLSSSFAFIAPPAVSAWFGAMAALVNPMQLEQRALLACVYKQWLGRIPGDCKGMIAVMDVLVAVPTTDGPWFLDDVNQWVANTPGYSQAVTGIGTVDGCCYEIAIVLASPPLEAPQPSLNSAGQAYYATYVQSMLTNLGNQFFSNEGDLFNILSPLRELYADAALLEEGEELTYPTWIDVFARIAWQAGRLHQFGCSLRYFFEPASQLELTGRQPNRPIATAVLLAYQATPAVLLTSYEGSKERTVGELEAAGEVGRRGEQISALDAELSRHKRALAALVRDAERNPIVRTPEFAELWAKGKGRLRDHDRVLESVERLVVELGNERAERAVRTMRGVREHVPGDSYDLVVDAFLGVDR